MFIDTHCHSNREDDFDAIIKRASDNNVGAMICSGAETGDAATLIALVNKYDNVFCTVGLHPECANQNIDLNTEFPDELFAHPKVLGIGEIGLDYHYGAEFKNQQIELFEHQLELAKRHHLPVAIHTREAEEDTTRILDGSVTGVMHCYTSSWELAKKMLDRGFFFSASGILTFKNSDELRETFAKIPTDRIVIETDAPYCAPIPYRGKPAEPFMVTQTATTLANIKNLQLDVLEGILFENTKKLYPRIKL